MKILDTTLRDGSYVLNFQFTAQDTYLIAHALDELDFPYIEVGHGIGLGASDAGLGRAAESDVVYMQSAARAVQKNLWGMFCIPGIAKLEHLDIAADHGMGFVRVGTNITEVEASEAFIERARKLGMFVCSNFMKSYASDATYFAQQARRSEEMGAQVVYLVDSAGGMLGTEVREYLQAVRYISKVPLGFHGHNNLGLAVSNSLIALEEDVALIDTSLQGLGRSAGNTPTELFLATLSRMNVETGVDMLATMDAGEKYIRPLMKEIGFPSLDVVMGESQFHSSYMIIIREFCTTYSVDPRLLIQALCRHDKLNAPRKLVRRLAEQLKTNQELELSRFKLHQYFGAEQSSDSQELDETTQLVERLHGVFQQFAQRECFVENSSGRRLTYEAVWDRAQALADAWRTAGLYPGDRICFFLPDGLEYAIGALTALIAGFTAVPISQDHSDSTITSIFQQVRPRAVVVLGNESRGCFANVRQIPITFARSNDMPTSSLVLAELPKSATDAGMYAWSMEEVATIHFTSGTTGSPKGVCHTFYSLCGNALAFNEAHGINSLSRFGHFFSQSYMAGYLNTILCPLVAGGSVVLFGRFDNQTAFKFWDLLQKFEVNSLWLSPTMLAAVLKLDRGKLGEEWASKNLSLVFSATAPLAMSLGDRFEERYGCRVRESYGLSELLLITAQSGFPDDERGSVGPLLESVELQIAPDGLDEPALNGEILVRTPFVMAGYLNSATGEIDRVSRETFFPTGDLGVVDAKGCVWITGRKKDIIIRGGANISPRTIEEVLSTHQKVQAAAVVGIPHDFYGEDVIAVLEIDSQVDQAALQMELKQLCAEQLGKHEQPSRFEYLGEFPRTSNGKILKTRIREIVISKVQSAKEQAK